MASKPDTADKKPATDWEAIEKDYRLGQLTVREIARRFDVSHTSITRKAEKLGWMRDLSDEIRAKTQAALLRTTPDAPRERTTPTRDDIAVAVQTNVALIREHRSDIGQTRSAVKRLIDELHDTLSNLDEIEEDIHEETEAPDGQAESKAEEQARFKRRQRMLAAVALPSRATVVNTLASALKTLIPLERQAFNLQDGSGDNPDEPRKALTADMTPQEAAEAYHDKLRRIGSG